MGMDEEINKECRELDILNEEPSGKYIPDENIFSIEELADRMVGVVSLLNHIDEYKKDVSSKRQEVDWKILDILHRLEDNIDDMSIYGMIKVILKLHELREMRRTLKVSDTAIFEFQKNTNRLNNESNREMLVHNVGREISNQTQPYKNRIYTEEQLNNIFNASELTAEEEEKVHNQLLQFEIPLMLNQKGQERPKQEEKKRRGRPPKKVEA